MDDAEFIGRMIGLVEMFEDDECKPEYIAYRLRELVHIYVTDDIKRTIEQ